MLLEQSLFGTSAWRHDAMMPMIYVTVRAIWAKQSQAVTPASRRICTISA